jgi:hypothetical protein
VLGEEAFGDQVVSCQAAGLEQDVAARTPLGGSGSGGGREAVGEGIRILLVSPRRRQLGAAPLRLGRERVTRAALVAR